MKTKKKPITLNTLAEKCWHKFWETSKSPDSHKSNLKKVVSSLGGRLKITEITTDLLEIVCDRWIKEGASKKTCNRRLAVVSKMLTMACQRGWLKNKPHIERFAETEGRKRWATIEEEDQMVKLLNESGQTLLASLVIVMADTGMRRGEALALSWSDVDIEKGWIRCWENKADKPRSIPMTSRVHELLGSTSSAPGVEWLNDQKGPFTSVTPTTFAHHWNKCKAKMGLQGDSQFTPHCLRHACASRLVQAGVPLFTVKEFLGHKKIESTLVYAHLAPQNLQEACKVLEQRRET